MKENKKSDSMDRSMKLIVRSSLIVFIGVLLSNLLAYAYRVIIAKYFGPEVYGLFSLALIVIGISVQLFSVGLGDALTRFVPLYRGKKKTDNIRYLIRLSLIVSVISGLVGAVLLFFLSKTISVELFHNAGLTIFLQGFSCLMLIQVFAQIFLNVVKGYERVSQYSFAFNILQNLVKVISLVFFILVGLKVSSVIVSYILGIFSMLLFTFYICKYQIVEVFEKYAEQDFSKVRKEFLAYSFPTMFYAIISTIFYWIDSFSLGYLKDASIVGIYNAAVPIAMLLTVIPELFMQLFFPMITRAYSTRNLKLLKQLSKQVAKWILIIDLPVFTLLFLFPGAALNLLFGAAYLSASVPLQLLLIGALISSVATVPVQLVSVIGKPKLILINMILASVLNLILNFILIPMNQIGFFENHSGLVGASLATLISVIFFNLLFFLQIRKYLSFLPIKRKMISVFFAGLAAAIILYALRSLVSINLLTIALLAILFFVLYFGFILLIRAFDEKDWVIIKAIKRKLNFYVGRSE